MSSTTEERAATEPVKDKIDYSTRQLTHAEAVVLCERINAVMGERFAVVLSFNGGRDGRAKRERPVWTVIRQREYSGPRWYSWQEFVTWITAEAERINAALTVVQSMEKEAGEEGTR